MTLLHPSWFKRMDEIIEKRLPRDEAEKVALECAEIADRPEERKATETIRPLGSHRGEVKRAVAVIFKKTTEDLMTRFDRSMMQRNGCVSVAKLPTR